MREMKNILQEYVLNFGDFPPLMMTMDYADDFYQSAMKWAIEHNEPLTMERLEDLIKADGVEYDLTTPDEGKSAAEFAAKYARR